MRKTIIFCLLITLACFLLCSCTPPKSETNQTTIPTLYSEQDESGKTPAASEQVTLPGVSDVVTTEAGSHGEISDPQETIVSESDSVDATSNPQIGLEDDPELEVESEYIVDGGNGFGIGGN